ncbi:hypothetical protein LY76DRAFT_68591 [Colletotrichum caudatum]|nr:hypothetical protein LY76DRAFT_68591 [Colletotrichum caudatum]
MSPSLSAGAVDGASAVFRIILAVVSQHGLFPPLSRYITLYTLPISPLHLLACIVLGHAPCSFAKVSRLLDQRLIVARATMIGTLCDIMLCRARTPRSYAGPGLIASGNGLLYHADGCTGIRSLSARPPLGSYPELPLDGCVYAAHHIRQPSASLPVRGSFDAAGSRTSSVFWPLSTSRLRRRRRQSGCHDGGEVLLMTVEPSQDETSSEMTSTSSGNRHVADPRCWPVVWSGRLSPHVLEYW